MASDSAGPLEVVIAMKMAAILAIENVFNGSIHLVPKQSSCCTHGIYPKNTQFHPDLFTTQR